MSPCEECGREHYLGCLCRTEAPEKATPCYECGGNCYPECGQHPAGCLFSGVTCGEWAIDPACKLQHPHVEQAKARGYLHSQYINVKVLRYPG